MIITNRLILVLILFLLGLVFFIGLAICCRKRWGWKRLLLVPTFLLYTILLFLFYVADYYHADAAAEAAVESSDAVQVTDSSKMISFDGPGNTDVLILYPGAFVESEAYGPLARRLAEGGVDCVVLKAPFHMAMMDISEASIVDVSEYENIYVGGHSLGGSAAAVYASEHMDSLSGVVFLAAYPTKSLDKYGFRVLSLVGTEDGGYNEERWTKADALMPEDYSFEVIAGANHANYANYGDQNGDGKATISREEQQKISCEEILGFIQNK